MRPSAVSPPRGCLCCWGRWAGILEAAAGGSPESKIRRRPQGRPPSAPRPSAACCCWLLLRRRHPRPDTTAAPDTRPETAAAAGGVRRTPSPRRRRQTDNPLRGSLQGCCCWLLLLLLLLPSQAAGRGPVGGVGWRSKKKGPNGRERGGNQKVTAKKIQRSLQFFSIGSGRRPSARAFFIGANSGNLRRKETTCKSISKTV